MVPSGLTVEQRNTILKDAVSAALKSVSGNVESTEPTRALLICKKKKKKKKIRYVIDIEDDGTVAMGLMEGRGGSRMSLRQSVSEAVLGEILPSHMAHRRALQKKLKKVEKRFNSEKRYS